MQKDNFEDSIITLIDDDGKQRECEVLFTYNHPENGKDYVVLYPIDQLDAPDDEPLDLFSYTYKVDENGQGELFPLESDEEYDMINEVIDQYFEDLEEAEAEN